jgi:hypothetical protein
MGWDPNHFLNPAGPFFTTGTVIFGTQFLTDFHENLYLTNLQHTSVNKVPIPTCCHTKRPTFWAHS